MAISDRITSIEEHLKESYQELEGIGIDTTGVNNNLENIPKLLDGYWETLPKVTDEGTSITLDNTKEGKMKVLLKGNTSQEGTPTPDTPQDIHVVSGDNTVKVCGKNLFDKATATDGKEINNAQTGTFRTSSTWFITDYIRIEPSTQYKISGKDNGSAILFYGKDKTFIRGTTSGGTSGFTTQANDYYVILNGLITQKDTFQLEKGSTATTYTPYISASYPINLPEGMFLGSIGDYKDRFFKTSGKNLFDNNNVVWNRTANSSFNYNIDEATDRIRTSSFSIEGGKTYTLSGIPSGITLYRIRTYNEYEGQQIDSLTPTNNSFTLNSSVKYIHLLFSGSDFTDATKTLMANANIMLNEGTTALPYEPYGTDWYLKKEIGKVVLNGSENWNYSSSNILYKNNFLNYNSSAILYCDYYVYGGLAPNSSGAYSKGNNKFCGNSDNKTIYLRNDNLTDKATWETWLSTHNTTVYYVLATPTYTKIEGTLASQLEALNGSKSYTPQTNISQNNNDMASVLNATALSNGTVTPSLQGVQTLSLGQNVDLQSQEPIEEQTEEVEEQDEQSVIDTNTLENV